MSKHGHALEYASEEVRGDRDIVMKAVSLVGGALHYASAELKCDYEIVLTAVQQWGSALKYASEDLRGDARLIELALKNEMGLIFLRVTLLSGRTYHQIFDVDVETMEDLQQGGIGRLKKGMRAYMTQVLQRTNTEHTFLLLEGLREKSLAKSAGRKHQTAVARSVTHANRIFEKNIMSTLHTKTLHQKMSRK